MSDTSYRFMMSFRIMHPTLEPAVISAALEMQPSLTWKAGERRRTPKGDLLQGTYKTNYWCAPSERYEGDASPTDALLAWLPRLQARKEFLKTAHDSGGTIDFYITWGVGDIPGDTFSADLLFQLGSLGIAVSIEVFRQSASTGDTAARSESA